LLLHELHSFPTRRSSDLCSAAGYGFEVYRSKNKDRLFGFLLLSMMMPFAAIMIPLFKMFSQWGLLNSAAAVILPTATTAFMIFLDRKSTRLNSSHVKISY